MKVFDPIFGNPGWTEGQGSLTLSYLRRELEISQKITKNIINLERIGEFINLRPAKSTLSASFNLFATKVCSADDGDKFGIRFSDQDGLPSVKTLLKAVKIAGPSHAELREDANCDALQSAERCRFMAKTSGTSNRIWMVHWFQFLDRQFIVNMGGLRHVLKMPSFRIEKVLDGVFWQLTEEYFEPANPQHLAAQRAAMEHLGIWEFTPAPPFSLPVKPKPRRGGMHGC